MISGIDSDVILQRSEGRMYIPEHFQEKNIAKIIDLIDKNPLASLVTFREGVFDANHIPLLVEGRSAESLTLVGHVARSNGLWKESIPKENVLVIFRGASGYISPNWYPGKKVNENTIVQNRFSNQQID
jgi:transcriptional regulator